MTRNTYTTTLSLSLGGNDVEATVAYTVSWGRPARTYGRPEDCYPAEPSEIDGITVTHIDGAVIVGEVLTAEARVLEELISESDILLDELLEAALDIEEADTEERGLRAAQDRAERLAEDRE